MRRYAIVLIALVSSLAGLAPSAMAQAGVEVDLRAGYDNRYVSGHWMPIGVTVETSQAIAGVLEVLYGQPDGSSSVHTMDIEVPGGGKKEFDLVIPAPFDESPITARVVDEDEVLGSAEVTPLRLGNETLVGVFGQTPPEAMDSITSEPTLTEMIPAEFGLTQLDLGSAALEPLSYVVSDEANLDALAPEHHDALLDWVTTGGRLVIASDDPAAVSWPEVAQRMEWSAQGTRVRQAGRSLAQGRVGSFEVGLGEVLVTAGRASTLERDLYEAILAPVGMTRQEGRGEFFSDLGSSAEGELVQALNGSGADLQLSWFVGFLIFYLILVGPVNYLLLKRRGRKELLWITIPVLALAFSGVAYGLARGSRGDLLVRTAGIVFADEYGQRGRSIASVSSGTGGPRTLTFSTKAAVVPTFLPFWGSSQEGSTRITAEGAEVTIQTAPFSSHIARGTVDSFDGYLDASVSELPGGIGYEIVNRTPYEATDITLLYARDSVLVGDLAPGETTRGDFVPSDQHPRFGFRPGIGGGLRRALDSELRAQIGHSSFSAPYVVASIQGFDLEVALEGRPAGDVARFMVVSPVDVEFDERAKRLPAYAGQVHLALIDGFVQQYNPGVLTIEGFREAVFGYRTPEGVSAHRIQEADLHFAGNGPPQELERYDWKQERWIGVEGAQRRRLRATLPASAFSDTGEAYFRLQPGRHGFAEITSFQVRPVLR